jgi:Na+/H+ antiporter NhaC
MYYARTLSRLVGGLAFFCLAFCASPDHAAAQEQGAEIEVPEVVLKGIPFDVTVKGLGERLETGAGVTVTVEERTYRAAVEAGEATVEDVIASSSEVALVATNEAGATLATASVSAIPGWLALVPSVTAIVLALLLRQVVPAIFLGIWIGGALAYGLSLSGIWHGLLDTVPVYGLKALDDSDHLSIILFSFMIGGMVGIISKNGGTAGIVNAIVHWASSARRGQLTASALGVAIFFDDYANTLIVGNTMRPITDRLRISREKLAYIVDSTAAPVATLALVTTWIGFEVGLIAEAVGRIEGFDESAYSIFLQSILYNFYPLLAVFFVFLVAASGRDFGPMLHAERRSRTTGQLSRPDAHIGESPEEAREREPKPDQPQRATNAVIPVLVLVVGTLVGIYLTGAAAAEPGAPLREIVGNGDSYQAMMWASLLAVLVAAALSLGQRILTLTEVIDAWYAGVRSMLLAIIILVLAWALSSVNETLHTGDYLVSTLGTTLSPHLLPALVFVLAAFTAFATGSSWGVMGIMMPLTVPLAWAVMEANGLTADPGNLYILYAAVSAVLAGAVWGDHCSPISDTTILSSLASKCDHIDHVRTQLPYAVAVGGVALVVGLLPAGYGLPWWLALLASAGALTVGLWYLGEKAEHPAAAAAVPVAEGEAP